MEFIANHHLVVGGFVCFCLVHSRNVDIPMDESHRFQSWSWLIFEWDKTHPNLSFHQCWKAPLFWVQLGWTMMDQNRGQLPKIPGVSCAGACWKRWSGFRKSWSNRRCPMDLNDWWIPQSPWLFQQFNTKSWSIYLHISISISIYIYIYIHNT